MDNPEYKFLQYGLLDTEFSSKWNTDILKYVVSKDIGHRIAWEFVTENWSFLSERYGTELLHVVLKTMGRFIITDVQIQELQVFCNNTLEEDGRERATLLLEFSKTENMEMKEHLTRVADWLRKNIDA
ncbi:UNVERIFIED_CONTAM: hypothetical protein H355_015284 [Colinus virginianus]|nr:hypothetical protein H355_015284 [Colinus virginianus]